jgi:hypothetical protein
VDVGKRKKEAVVIELARQNQMPSGEYNLTRERRPEEVYLGFGVFARPRPREPKRNPILSLRILKPEREDRDFELLLDQRTFEALRKFAKKYW